MAILTLFMLNGYTFFQSEADHQHFQRNFHCVIPTEYKGRLMENLNSTLGSFTRFSVHQAKGAEALWCTL